MEFTHFFKTRNENYHQAYLMKRKSINKINKEINILVLILFHLPKLINMFEGSRNDSLIIQIMEEQGKNKNTNENWLKHNIKQILVEDYYRSSKDINNLMSSTKL